MTVERVVQCAEHTVGVGDRGILWDFARADELGFQPHVAVLGTLGLEKVHAVRGAREGEPAYVMQAAGLSGDLLELLI